MVINNSTHNNYLELMKLTIIMGEGTCLVTSVKQQDPNIAKSHELKIDIMGVSRNIYKHHRNAINGNLN